MRGSPGPRIHGPDMSDSCIGKAAGSGPAPLHLDADAEHRTVRPPDVVGAEDGGAEPAGNDGGGRLPSSRSPGARSRLSPMKS